MEQTRIHRRLHDLGVTLRTHHVMTAVGETVQARHAATGEMVEIEAGAVVLVTARQPVDQIAVALEERRPEWTAAGLGSVQAIGDAWAPGTIAAAVWSGRRYAEELGEPSDDGVPFRREIVGWG